MKDGKSVKRERVERRKEGREWKEGKSGVNLVWGEVGAGVVVATMKHQVC
jgi:hypothetical protein